MAKVYHTLMLLWADAYPGLRNVDPFNSDLVSSQETRIESLWQGKTKQNKNLKNRPKPF